MDFHIFLPLPYEQSGPLTSPAWLDMGCLITEPSPAAWLQRRYRAQSKGLLKGILWLARFRVSAYRV